MSRRRSGAELQELTSSEKDSTNTSESSLSMSPASDSSSESATSEGSLAPTPGTEPQIIITFGSQGIRFVFSDDIHSVSLSMVERATLLLRREVMRERRRLAHQAPAARVAGYDNSHERDRKGEVANVA